jgi:hypothetical protein
MRLCVANAPAGSGGLANLAATLPFSAQGQLVADYIVETSGGGGTGATVNTSIDGGVTTGGHSQTGGATFESK